MLRYIRVATASVQRYRIESQYRDLYYSTFPDSKRNISFGNMMARLAGRKVVNWRDIKPILQRYKRLSKIVHASEVTC